MEKSVNKRFLEAVEYLLEQKLVSTKKELAARLGYKPPYITEILKDRINVSGEHIKRLSQAFPEINSRFIIGVSDEISSLKEADHAAESAPGYGPQFKHLQIILDMVEAGSTDKATMIELRSEVNELIDEIKALKAKLRAQKEKFFEVQRLVEKIESKN